MRVICCGRTQLKTSRLSTANQRITFDMSFVLSKQMENEILEDMNYSRDQLKKDLELLRVWLVEQKHLPPSRLKETDNFLVHFLVGCKGSLENAKRKVDAYYTLRGVGPVFSKRDNVELLKQAALSQYLWVSPNPLPDGTLIYMIGARNTDVELYDSDNTTRRSLLVAEYIMRESGIIRGQQVLIDAAGFSAGHVLRTPPTNLKTIVTFISDAYPVRVKKLIIYNAPPVLETMINTFVKPLMAEKLQERLIVTKQNIDQVFAYVDELPSTYGGKKGDISDLAGQWEATLESWDYLPNLEEVVNEDIRPKTTRDCLNPYFGLHGSIKALVID